MQLTSRETELLRIQVIFAPRRLAACNGANRAGKDANFEKIIINEILKVNNVVQKLLHEECMNLQGNVFAA
jgi:predicted small secreted protein